MSNEKKKNAAKSTAPAAAIDSDGFEALPVIDGEQKFDESTWVEPDEGVVIEGELTRAFVIPDTLGAGKGKPFRACFGVRDADGGEWTFGEKAAFKPAIRKLSLGDVIRLEFTGKEALIVNGRPSGKTVWRVKFAVKRALKPGAGVMATLFASHAELVERGEDLPF